MFSGFTFSVAKAVIFLICAMLVCSAPAIGSKRKRRPKAQPLAAAIFNRYPGLKGSPEKLKKENDLADEFNLPRIANDKELGAFVESGFLVRVPNRRSYFYLDSPKPLRFASPEAVDYMSILSQAYSLNFKRGRKCKCLKITSLTRTGIYQKRLVRRNPNAASGSEPDKRSVHLTGYTFDVSTRNMGRDKISWLAGFLARDAELNIIDAIYEPHNSNFHVFVFPKNKRPR